MEAKVAYFITFVTGLILVFSIRLRIQSAIRRFNQTAIKYSDRDLENAFSSIASGQLAVRLRNLMKDYVLIDTVHVEPDKPLAIYFMGAGGAADVAKFISAVERVLSLKLKTSELDKSTSLRDLVVAVENAT